MKKIIQFTLFMLAILLPTTTFSQEYDYSNNYDFKVDGICYKIINLSWDGTCAVVTGDANYSGAIKIPEEVSYYSDYYGTSMNLRVTNIGYHGDAVHCRAFTSSAITSIELPSTINMIEDDAFYSCSGLAGISVDNDNPFYDSRNNCNAIIRTSDNTLILGCGNSIIPNSVDSIGKEAFLGCIGLTSINIPNSVKSIGKGAFAGCIRLTNIDIPNSVISIAEYAFDYCSDLTSITVDIDNRIYDSRDNCNAIIKTLEDSLILGCRNTIIPNSINSIGYRAFANCDSLTNIEIPNSVIVIGNSSFYECRGLTSITIPNSVTVIGSSAFYECRGLTSATIGNSVTTIGSSAFFGCSNLADIVIGNSVNSIESGAFSSTAWYNNQPDGLVYAGRVAYRYKGAMPAGTSIPWKDGTLGIASGAFSNRTSLTSIDIPNSVITIGSDAFVNCSSLTNITIPNSVKSIGYYAFENCTSLTNVTIGNSVTTLGDYAFVNCNRLDTLNFNAINCTDFSSWSSRQPFYNLNISTIIIGNSVQKIPAYFAFHLPKLTNVIIGNSVITIGDKAFDICSSLTNVSIPNSVTTIGSCVFANCRKLNEVYSYITDPTSITIDYYTFSREPTNYTDRTLYIPAGTLAAYQADNHWSDYFGNIVEMVHNGDANGDGVTSIKDVTDLIDYLLGGATSSFDSYNADVSGDGIITIKDVTDLIDQLLGSE